MAIMEKVTYITFDLPSLSARMPPPKGSDGPYILSGEGDDSACGCRHAETGSGVRSEVVECDVHHIGAAEDCGKNPNCRHLDYLDDPGPR